MISRTISLIMISRTISLIIIIILLAIMTMLLIACGGEFSSQTRPKVASEVKIRLWTSFDDGRYIQEEINSKPILDPQKTIFYPGVGVDIAQPTPTITRVWARQPTASVDGVAVIASFIELTAPGARVVVTDEMFLEDVDGSIYVNLVGNGTWGNDITTYRIGFSAAISFD